MYHLDLDRLFNPKSLVMIGASAKPFKWGYIILLNILKGNYSGTVYLVNPKKEPILGLGCYGSVKDIPGRVDLAIITTPAQVVPSLIDECGEKGIPFVAVVTADFSETGPKGAKLEFEIVAKAKKYGMRLVGPNTMGIFSQNASLHALMPPVMPLSGPVSMFSQSGNVGVQMLAWGCDEGVGFEKFVSSGITRGGGWGVITADSCEENGLLVPSLPKNLQERFNKLLPKYWSHGNPVDLVATISTDPYLECLKILAHWDGIDSIIALGARRTSNPYPYSNKVKGPDELLNAIDKASQYIKNRAERPDDILIGMGRLIADLGKPIFAVSIGSDASHKFILEKYNVVSFPTPERAVRVLTQMVYYRRYLNSQA